MDNSDWYNHIDLLRTKIKKNISKKELSETLKKNIISSIPKEPFGILLSGGVDSTLIAKVCKDHGADFRCFCVGTKGSVDVKGAKIAAEELGLDLNWMKSRIYWLTLSISCQFPKFKTITT